MCTARGFARLIWGDDLDRELGAKRELPYGYLVGAILAGISGFAGGHLSDRIGRRRVILLAEGLMVGYPLVLLALSSSKWGGIVALTF